MKNTKHALKIYLSLIFVFAVCALPSFGQSPNEPQNLEPNQTVEREMTGIATHRYKFDLQANEFFQVRVEQKQVDVTLKLTDEKGDELAAMDSPNGREGFEILTWVTKVSGNYVLEVINTDTKVVKGSYIIKRENSRTALEKDKRRVEVEKLFADGIATRNIDGQQEIALNKLEKALEGWNELQDANLADLTAINLFLLTNQLPYDVEKKTRKLFNEGTQESYIESRKQAFKAIDLFHRLYQQVDSAIFTDVFVKNKVEKAEFKLTAKLGEVNMLSFIASIYNRLGNSNESVNYNKLSLVVLKEVRADKELNSTIGFKELKSVFNLQEASINLSIGTSLSTNLNKPREAIDYLKQSIILYQNLSKEDDSKKDYAKLNQVTALQGLGIIFNKLDNSPQALDYFQQALAMIQTIPNQKSYETTILLNIATAHFSAFNYEKALSVLDQTLKIADQLGDFALKSDCLNYIKTIYFDLGDEKPFREFARQENSLLLSPEYLDYVINRIQSSQTDSSKLLDSNSKDNKNGVSEFYKKTFDCLRLMRIGNNYKLLEDYENSIKYYERGLSLALEINQSDLESQFITQIADLYVRKKDWKKAIEYSQKELDLIRSFGNREDVALALRDIGYAYLESGDAQKALPYFNEAIGIWYSLGANNNVTIYRHFATTLSHLARTYYAIDNKKLAIFYGKQSVNGIQKEREQLKNFDQSLQHSYLQKNEKPYRRLADWLFEVGQFAEAEQVLRMLKEEEFSNFVRRDPEEIDKLGQRLEPNAAEKPILVKYSLLADNLAKIGVEYEKIKKEKGDACQTDARCRELKQQVTDANTAFNTFLDKELVKEFEKVPKKNVKEDFDKEKSRRDLLKEQNAVSIYTLVGEDRLRVFLTTSQVQVDRKKEIKAEELNKKIRDFREALKNPQVDPRPLGKELYDILIAPIEKQIADSGAKTLLFSLDGTLRYIPIAALWDGKQYLVEKYQIVLLTSATKEKLYVESKADWKIFGGGVTEKSEVSEPQRKGFDALPSVKAELDSIIRGDGTPGIFDGSKFINGDFTKENIENGLSGTNFNVLHLATHFSLGNDDGTSFLLLGNNQTLTLKQIRDDNDIQLGNLDLVVLSACETAFGNSTNGGEVDSSATFFELNGAKSVIASLWSVADNSTSELMIAFYQIRRENPQLSKAEALRLAQVKLLNGKYKTGETPSWRGAQIVGTPTANLPPFKTDVNAPFAHPYYWSPFILIGNWK